MPGGAPSRGQNSARQKRPHFHRLARRQNMAKVTWAGVIPGWTSAVQGDIPFGAVSQTRSQRDPWNEKSQRNDAIYERRKQGATFKEIGQEFGITLERVRQICLHRDRRNKRALFEGRK